MIIFGSRMYGKRNVAAGWGRCEACGHYGQLSNYNARKWGHIYYIPLIPSGPPRPSRQGMCQMSARLPHP